MKKFQWLPSGIVQITALLSALILMLVGFAITPSNVYADSATNSQNQRVVQVVLHAHAKISQYTHIDSSVNGFGKNACGLVAAAAAVGEENWVPLVDVIADAAGHDYDKDTGIQPSKYVSALQQVFGAQNVVEKNNSSLPELYRELQAGNIVIVDVKVNVNQQAPSASNPSYAHFARVLGMDMGKQEIYIENTLRGAPYWTVSFRDFMGAWTRPETTASLIPDQKNAEDVTHWAVILQGKIATENFASEL